MTVRRSLSDHDPLDFVEADGVRGTVIEFGGAGGFVTGDSLGVFERAAVGEISSDAGGTEGVAGDMRWKPCGESSAFDHAEDVGAMHAMNCELAGS